MRNFLFSDNGFNNSEFQRDETQNGSNNGLLDELLSSDNTEILLFLIVFLLLFTSFGRR